MLSRLPVATLRHGPRHLSQGFCFSYRHRNSSSLSDASCSALYRMVSPTPMASADFCPPFPAPSDAGSTRQADRPPRVRRVTFLPYTRRIYRPILPDGYWALKSLASSPGWDGLVCDSCSSGRDFACGFLQIPPRDGHPCRSASGSRHQGPRGTCTPKSSGHHHNDRNSASQGASRHAWRTKTKAPAWCRGLSSLEERLLLDRTMEGVPPLPVLYFASELIDKGLLLLAD